MSQELQKKTESPNSLALSKEQNRLIGDWIKNETEYQVALTYGEKRLRDYNREDMTKLVEVMAKWRLLLGVTTESSDQELIVICQFVYDNFKHFTLADISLAMNWAISGKSELAFVSQKTISSYYVSRALNAYESKKRELVNQMVENRDRYLIDKEIENKKKPSPAELADIFKELLVSMYKAYTDGGLFYDPGDSVYNWLKEQKLINPDKSQVAAALRYGEDKYKEVQKSDSLKSIMEKGLRGTDKENTIKKYAREFITMQVFEEHGLGKLVGRINTEQFKKI